MAKKINTIIHGYDLMLLYLNGSNLKIKIKPITL